MKVDKKSRENDFPTAQNMRGRGYYFHLPTAFADYNYFFNDQPETVGKLFLAQ